MASLSDSGNKLVLQGQRRQEALDILTRFNFSLLVGFQAGSGLSDAFFNTIMGY